MTPRQFRELDEMEQAEAIWEAEFVRDRTDAPYRYELYKLYGFYIQLKRHIEYNVLHGLTAFEPSELLDAEWPQNDTLPGKDN